jgi:hypothetical protein
LWDLLISLEPAERVALNILILMKTPNTGDNLSKGNLREENKDLNVHIKYRI